MTAPTQAARRPPFVAIVVYALQACLPAKRRLGLLLPCVGAVLFGLLAHLDTATDTVAFANVAGIALFAIVIPIGCLVIGDAVLGAEARSGTLHFTWLSPVPLATIVVGRWLAGFVASLASVTLACVVAAIVAGAPDAAPAVALAAAAGCAAYIGLFVMIGAITRRAAVWSLAIVVLVERLLGAALAGIAQLSPMWEARAVFAELGPGADDLIRDGIPQGWGAVIRLGIVLVVTLVVASWRLSHLRLTGASD